MTHADQPPADPNGLRRRALWVISRVSALYGVQFGMLVPLVPLYRLWLGYNTAWPGAVISAQGAFQFLLPLFAGAVSDRFGERVVLRAGLVALLVSALVFVTSEAVWALIGAQLFIGAGRAVYNPAAQSYATRISETDRARVIGRYRAAEALGQGVGPLLGGVLAFAVDFDAAFAVVAAGSAAALVARLRLPGHPRGVASPPRAQVGSAAPRRRSTEDVVGQDRPQFVPGSTRLDTVTHPQVIARRDAGECDARRLLAG